MLNRKWIIALGIIGVSLLACSIVLAIATPRIALYLGGFRGGQDTAAYLEEVAVSQEQSPIQWQSQPEEGALAPVVVEEIESDQASSNDSDNASAPLAQNAPRKLERVTVQIDGQRSEIAPDALYVSKAETAATSSGQAVYYFEYNETDLNGLIANVLLPQAPEEITNQMRNVQVDLKPSAAIVSGEANLAVGWQPLSVIVAFNSSGTAFTIAGVDIGGQLYSSPPDGFIGDWVRLAEVEGNRALQDAAFLGPNGESLTIDQLYIGDEIVQVVAR